MSGSNRRAFGWGALLSLVVALGALSPAWAADSPEKRGEYLVKFGGCSDCHTPGYFLGKLDASRVLAGSDVGFEVPGLGTFLGPNLTPDDETGLGKWTLEEIRTAIQEGKTPEGRMLAPVMPWHDFANLTKSDGLAIAAYLKSLKPIRNEVPGPFGPNEKATTFVMRVVPPGAP